MLELQLRLVLMPQLMLKLKVMGLVEQLQQPMHQHQYLHQPELMLGPILMPQLELKLKLELLPEPGLEPELEPGPLLEHQLELAPELEPGPLLEHQLQLGLELELIIQLEVLHLDLEQLMLQQPKQPQLVEHLMLEPEHQLSLLERQQVLLHH